MPAKKKKPAALRQFRITRHDPSSIPSDAAICLFGPKRQGKSTALRHIVRTLNPDRAVAFCGTGDAYDSTIDFMPEIYVHRNMSLFPVVLQAHIEEQKRFRRKFRRSLKEIEKETGVTQVYRKDDPRASLKVYYHFDDIGFEQKILKGQDMRFMAGNGRHMGPMSFSFQYPNDCPTFWRGNFDVIYICNIPNQDNFDLVYKKFQNCFYDKADFMRLYHKLTQKWRIMVIDNTKKKADDDFSEDIVGVSAVERKVSFFDAEPDFKKGFIIGDAEYKQYHEIYFNDEEDLSEEEESLSPAAAAETESQPDIILLEKDEEPGIKTLVTTTTFGVFDPSAHGTPKHQSDPDPEPQPEPAEKKERLYPMFEAAEENKTRSLSRAMIKGKEAEMVRLMEAGASLSGGDCVSVISHTRSDLVRTWWKLDTKAKNDPVIAGLMSGAFASNIVECKHKQLHLAMTRDESELCRSLMTLHGASLCSFSVDELIAALSVAKESLVDLWWKYDKASRKSSVIQSIMHNYYNPTPSPPKALPSNGGFTSNENIYEEDDNEDNDDDEDGDALSGLIDDGFFDDDDDDDEEEENDEFEDDDDDY